MNNFTLVFPLELDKKALPDVVVPRDRGGWSRPENRAFWKAVNAARFNQRGAGRTAAYRAVAYYVALTERRICYAAVATMAKRARLSLNTMRRQLQGFNRGWRTGGRWGGVARQKTNPVPVDIGRCPTLPRSTTQPSHYGRGRRSSTTVRTQTRHEFPGSANVRKARPLLVAANGPDCHECNLERAHRPRERKATLPPARVRIGAPKSGPFEWTEADERALQACKAAEMGGRRVTTSLEAAQRACTGIGAVG